MMKTSIPRLDVIDTKAPPQRCPACGSKAIQDDGHWPNMTRVSCACGWFARYRQRPAEPPRV